MIPLPAESTNPLWWLGIALLGCIVGVVAGMFGIGGNFLLIPTVNALFGVPMPIAVGSGLCQVIGSATGTLYRFRKLKQGEVILDWLMLAGGLLGASAGARTVQYFSTLPDIGLAGIHLDAPKLLLSSAFLLILLVVAVGMFKDVKNRPSSDPITAGPLTRLQIWPMVKLTRADREVSAIIIAQLGLFVGFISGLVGMGGGIVLLPMLIYGIGLRMKETLGTGLLMLVVSAMAGTWTHALLGHVHFGLASTLLVGSTIGAPVGATISARAPGRTLRKYFVILLTLTAGQVIWNIIRSIK